MTDNEKRAHDLAVASIPYAIEQSSKKLAEDWVAKNGIQKNITLESGIDLFECYINIYNSMLGKFKREFPDNQ